MCTNQTTKMSDWICLNVGGTIFETTRTTLTSVPGSLLAKMFDVDSSLPPASTSEDGTFRLDADPRAFAVILYWLRYKRVFLSKDIEAEAVIPVADYFGLQDLLKVLELLKEPVTKKDEDDIITLDVGGTICKTTRASLTRDKGSRFAQMFVPGSTTAPPVTKEGNYWIDSDPRIFAIILNWLRSYNYSLLDNLPSHVTREEVLAVAKALGSEN